MCPPTTTPRVPATSLRVDELSLTVIREGAPPALAAAGAAATEPRAG
jgi:hypothetical protein